MGQVKRLIPSSAKPAVERFMREKIPEPIQRQAGNAATFLGWASVEAGAKIGGRLGMFLRMLGHFGDDVDGDLARFYGVAGGIVGILGDQVADRRKIFVEGREAFRGISGLEDLNKLGRQIVVGTIAGKLGTITALNGIALARGRHVESLGSGKVNFYADSLTLGFFGWADVVHSQTARNVHNALGYTMFAAGLVTGQRAINDYYNVAFGPLAPEINADGTIETFAVEIPPEAGPLLGIE